jgi:hypothetical protein
MRTATRVLVVTATLGLSAGAYLSAQDAQAEKTIIANERAVNAAVAKADLAGFQAHVSAEGWAIDPMGGRMSVAEFTKTFPEMSKSMKITSWDITDTQVLWVDANTAVLTYKWTGTGTYEGQPIPSPTWASTVWTKKAGKWTAVYHQETLVLPPPPPKK